MVEDNDYPNAPFICSPDIEMLGCVDGPDISANSAVSRIQAILNHRSGVFFSSSPIKQLDDLRFAVNEFRIYEVDYELVSVNPHTGDLGRALDENNKRDHIEKMKGKLIARDEEPLKLNGGTLSQVQELQESGHARVGYLAKTDEGHEIRVPKPSKPAPHDLETDEPESRNLTDVRLRLHGVTVDYPFPDHHVDLIVNIMRTFSRASNER